MGLIEREWPATGGGSEQVQMCAGGVMANVITVNIQKVHVNTHVLFVILFSDLRSSYFEL